MVQVIIWPLRLVTAWTLARTSAIDATMTGWLLLAGAAVAAAIGTERPGPRNLAMAVCLAMCLAGPALAYVGAMSGMRFDVLVNMSPLMEVRNLAYGAGAPVEPVRWGLIGLLYTAAACSWIALAVWTVVRRSSPEDRAD
jgi:hypothetical protein